MKTILATLALTLISSQAHAIFCPSPSALAKAIKGGATTFGTGGERLDNDPIGMGVSEVTITKYMDKASPKIGSPKHIPVSSVWKAPAGLSSDPEWKFNITLKRGIFGDGATYYGAEITYGGRVSCTYDFSEVGGLGLDFLKIEGISAACVPANPRNWMIRIPADRALDANAAQCRGKTPEDCALACLGI